MHLKKHVFILVRDFVLMLKADINLINYDFCLVNMTLSAQKQLLLIYFSMLVELSDLYKQTFPPVNIPHQVLNHKTHLPGNLQSTTLSFPNGNILNCCRSHIQVIENSSNKPMEMNEDITQLNRLWSLSHQWL